jgi:hypothetical protein
MSTNTLAEHVQAQLARLTPSDKKRLAAIIADCCALLERLHKIRTGALPPKEWTPAIRMWTASLAQMEALVEAPHVLHSFAQDGRDGAGSALHVLPPETWGAYLHERTTTAQEGLRALRDAVIQDYVPPPIPIETTPADPTLFNRGNWDLTEPGYADYKGVRFPLGGRNRRLLARLIIGEGRAVHSDHLIHAAQLAIDRGGVAPYISRLRSHLRKSLSDLPSDPIPYCDPDGYRLAIQ